MNEQKKFKIGDLVAESAEAGKLVFGSGIIIDEHSFKHDENIMLVIYNVYWSGLKRCIGYYEGKHLVKLSK